MSRCGKPCALDDIGNRGCDYPACMPSKPANMTKRVDDAVLAELQRQCYTDSDRYKIATELIERRRAEKAEAIPVASIEREIAHIKQNGIALAKYGVTEAEEGRCRELCAVYLQEFIDAERMNKRLVAIEAEKAAVPLAWMRPRKDGYDSAFRDAAVVEACTGNSWDGWIPLYAHAAPPAGMDIPTIMSEVGKLVDAAAIYDPIGYDNGETAAQMAKIRVMLAAAERGARQQQSTGWQPIETAPKDGTRIILSWSGQSLQGFYIDNSKSLAPWKGFRSMSGELTPPGKPDAWMPLPPPPAERGAK